MAKTIILITGANSGVGYAATSVITKTSDQYHVIMGCRSIEKAEKVKAEIEASGIKGSISIVQLDVTDRELIKQASEHIKSQFGRLDVLVNNAAIGKTSPDLQTRLRATFETNVSGPLLVADAFLPLLLEAKKPYSIYVSSGMGSFQLGAERPQYSDYPNGEAYRMSKAALNMAVFIEHQKNKEKGLKTFALCPGFVRSNLRGTDPEEISGGGLAEDPVVSGKLILSVIEGKRDADEGRLVQTNGLYGW